jgi:hypothetical protein
MDYVKVKLLKSWGANNYYSAGNVVCVTPDVAKMMTTGSDRYGDIIENKDREILDAYHAYNLGEEE